MKVLKLNVAAYSVKNKREIMGLGRQLLSWQTQYEFVLSQLHNKSELITFCLNGKKRLLCILFNTEGTKSVKKYKFYVVDTLSRRSHSVFINFIPHKFAVTTNNAPPEILNFNNAQKF